MKHLRLSKFGLAAADFFAFICAYALGSVCLIFWGKYEALDQLSVWWSTTGLIHTGVHAAFVFICLGRFYVQSLYSKRQPFWDELRSILSTLVSLALLNGIVVLVAKWPFSRVLWLGSWVGAMVLIPLFRSFARKVMRRLEIWQRPTIVVGCGPSAADTLSALQAEPQLGFQIVEFINLNSRRTPAPPLANHAIKTVSREGLVQYLKTHPDHEIFLALDENELSESGPLAEELGLHFPELYFVPTLSGLPLFGMEAYHFFSHELLILRAKNNLAFRPQVFFKRIFDLVLTLLFLILFAPLMLWIAMRIRLAGSAIFFQHMRVGFGGKVFPCYKFRTMVPNAEIVLQEILERDPLARRQWDEKMKLDNDPRITSIGHFLRKTSFDELPQLWNVLRGDMSLVGPRPITAIEMERYGHRIEFYQRVRPGLTGLWQVSGRSDTDYGTRVRLDTWYAKNWTLWYDIVILFKTVKTLLNRKGAY